MSVESARLAVRKYRETIDGAETFADTMWAKVPAPPMIAPEAVEIFRSVYLKAFSAGAQWAADGAAKLFSDEITQVLDDTEKTAKNLSRDVKDVREKAVEALPWALGFFLALFLSGWVLRGCVKI
jgi:hypothetical protein